MATLAHSRPGGSGRHHPMGDDRAILERAITRAQGLPRPRGWRQLFARDRSAAALVRRYDLWPAIEHAYERIESELGRIDVSFVVQECFGETDVVMNCVGEAPADFEKARRLERQLWMELQQMLGSDWSHLSVYIDGELAPACV